MNLINVEQNLKSKTGPNWSLGVSTLLSPNKPVEGIKKLLKSISGLQRIEVSLAKKLETREQTVKELMSLKKKHNLHYSVHAPFLYDDLAHPREIIREVYIDEGKRAIDLAASIEARDVVFHPGHLFFRQNLPPLDLFEPLRKPRKYYLKNSLQSLKILAKYGASRGVNLLIENLPHDLCDRSGEIKHLVSRLENADFLLDIGHAHISDTLNQLFELKPRYFHFHDNTGDRDSHRQLGRGTINLSWLKDQLGNYKGDKRVIFEFYSVEDVLSSLKTLSDL